MSECPNFVIGFYVGRKMHRPGLSELEILMKHAESLPVDGVDGQDYLRCAMPIAAMQCRCMVLAHLHKWRRKPQV